MSIHYPGSFLKLLLTGFAFAVIPLVWAFANTIIAFDKLAAQSEATIYTAVNTTRSVRILEEQAYLMERSIRQYYVLQDSALFNNYRQAEAKFDDAAIDLQKLSTNASQRNKIRGLVAHMQQLDTLITHAAETHSTNLEFLNAFSQIKQQIKVIIEGNNSAIDQSSAQLTLAAQKTQRNLFIQSLILIPLALSVAGGIAFMLARPIRRMDNAIKALGAGSYEEPIAIDGPADLRALGERLDWLRNELRELNQQKQQFLRHISHELKTPLTAIREATELLNDGIGGKLSAQQSEITNILKDNTIRLQRMIENLLSYTRLESIQLKLNLQPVNLSELIYKVIRAHELSIRSKALTINTHLHLRHLTADYDKLLIILDNLVSNAVRYSPDHGQIHLYTNEDKSRCMIEVIDNGPGLSKQDQEKLFSPFYQGMNLHKSLISGTGLGLSITKDLVEAHQGQIELVASAQGAHFLVTLPKKIALEH